MNPEVTSDVLGFLVLAFAVTYLLSGWNMAKKRGVLSAIFWSFIPFRWLLNMAVDGDYDDNPEWLDRIQTGIIIAFCVVWFIGKSNFLASIHTSP